MGNQEQTFVLIKDYMWFNHKIELVSLITQEKQSQNPKMHHLGPCNFDLSKATKIDEDKIQLECD